MTISAVVLTHNSNNNNPRTCIRSLNFCDEIIVVDDYSADRSIENISKDLKHPNLYVHKNRLDNDFSKARNFGLSKASGDWVLFIDSDEEVTKDLAQEILAKTKMSAYDGYYLRRTDTFMGKRLEYGETASVRFLRLATKGAGKWEGAVHEIWKVNGDIGALDHPIVHHHEISIQEYLERLDTYSTIKSQELYDKSIQEPFEYHFLKPIGKFIYNYVISLGFLDGYPGLAMAWLMSWHSLLVRVKLRLLYLNNPSLFKEGKAEH